MFLQNITLLRIKYRIIFLYILFNVKINCIVKKDNFIQLVYKLCVPIYCIIIKNVVLTHITEIALFQFNLNDCNSKHSAE